VHSGDPEVSRRVKEFREAAKSAGVKLTHQRLEILREVIGRTDHPSAEAVYRAVRVRMPTISLDTVYRTLWLLTDLGVVTTLGPRREVVRFDPNLKHHHHFVCMRCGLVQDFMSADFDHIRVPEALLAVGEATSTHVDVRGVCIQCAQAREL